MRFRFVALAGMALLVANCSSSTSPSATRTPASPTTTEPFVATLGVGGTKFYSFSVSQYGTVNVNLNNVDAADGPSAVPLGVGIGAPSGTGCAGNTIPLSAGPTALVTGVYEPGVYCALVYDVGSLVVPVRFNVSIAHP
jgi:hypothetical protein